MTKPLGYAPPLFGKRGYHVHFGLRGNAVLNRPMLDRDSGFMLTPMRSGVRLTTGAEFARDGAPPTPGPARSRRAGGAHPACRSATGWRRRPGWACAPACRTCCRSIGPLPGRAGLWCAFGHAHQGLTLGPTTGRLLAEMMTGRPPFIDPAPYDPARFRNLKKG